MKSSQASFNPASVAKSRVGAWLQGGYDYSPAAMVGLDAKGLVNRSEIQADALEQSARVAADAQIEAAGIIGGAQNAAFGLQMSAF